MKTTARVLRSVEGRSAIEALLVAVLVAVFVLIAVDRYYSSVRTVKETALLVEMSNLRSALSYYLMFNEKLPISLKEMVDRGVDASKRGIEGADYRIVISGKYVETMTLDPEGFPVDPFGNRYNYDASSGMIRSSTRGYERW
ncbi:MAG: hypothetical protein A2X93_09625 [Deltaproteobacteria bacterium GWC2_56_8]|nr:MAG: hypothetical protein A2X93_09625 [Deltaproteobacteria bacterium GWC2_56_8]HAO93546.1 hypothetical protein [Deltaproteobacteria bacterium]